jgi:hypothetical protein
MSAYVRAQSAAEIFRNAAHLYRTNFRAVLLVYLLPMSPVLAGYGIAAEMESRVLTCTASLILVIVTSIATLPITAVISDICLGNQPDLARAFRLLFDGKILGTYLLTVLLALLGFVLLVVPGLVLCVWYLFVIPIMVIEGRRGWQALERSRSLGKGHFWRILGILLLALTVVCMVNLLISATLSLIHEHLGPPMVAPIAGQLLSGLLDPIASIVSVLLYYDLRARKEAYDSAALAEDLKH